ncbi:MAG: Nif3-like dinuclear metal center hexameric protein [Tannerellaceae bacterium]|jgi:dinuclear metal center YbgI/SA1388 family protein|nr:Nif3-like dinuclear metal center hexameric protein [Tannerellaceae bacterium]
MNIREILREIEQYAPLPLQESFDNAGVQTGDVNRTATGALLCLDVTEAIVDEAIRKGCNLIIAHHPLAFKPFKSLTGKTYEERCIIKACKHDLVIYAAHTNLDNAKEGINHYLGERIGLRDMHILSPQKNILSKLVTFVPQSFAETVRQALFAAGAGHIGNYDACSFNLAGEGTFRPGANSQPFCGEAGKLHHEKEIRIETILPTFRQDEAIRALRSAHPYEEPAFDLYPLNNHWDAVGSGIVGELPEIEEAHPFLLRIKELFGPGCVKHSTPMGKPVRRVAFCSGSGAFLIPAAIASKADAFITGEARYNDFYDAEDNILLVVIGHYESEICTKDIFYRIISKKFPTFALHLSNVNSNPVKYL